MTLTKDTWLTDVLNTLTNLGGEAHYGEIYKEAERVRRSRGATWPDSAKAVIRRTLEEQSSDTDSFKGKDLFYSAKGIGKGVWGIRPNDDLNPPVQGYNFQTGELYNRKNDIHAKLGGSYQGGICPSKKHPYIFLFTGSMGEQYGYSDGWDEDGLFNYTGEGQIGDMRFTNGNKAIRDHVQDGRDLMLFQQRGKGKSYRFMGQFVCVGYETKQIPDKANELREGIVFQLKNVDEDIEYEDIIKVVEVQNLDTKELRKKAYSAVTNTKKSRSCESKRTYFERNQNIKDYVLSRSQGLCECCGIPAPFFKKNGTPYLEPHHIHKLSDKGLDHPRMMAALTPNCHREIHHGAKGGEIDDRLAKAIAEKEDLLEKGL